jgi:hypothetical protein
MNGHPIFPLAVRTLKVVGVILILSFLLDFVILSFPSGPRDSQWQVGFATALVDRGIIPLVGLALIFAGYWIEKNNSDFLVNRKSWLDLRLWAVLSSLLGLVFLLLVPIHLNNVNQARAQTIEQISQDATRAESNLQAQLGQLQTQLGDERVQAELERQRSQFRSQVNELLQDEQRFNQAIQSGQISETERKLLQQFKADPKSLDAYVAQQADPQTLLVQRLNQIRAQQEQLKQQARQDAWKSGLRIGMSGLLLAFGYIVIGWTGLRSMGTPKSSRHQSLPN